MEVLKKLEGAYALLIKSTHYPGELVACKRGSPLIMGIKVRPQPTQIHTHTHTRTHTRAHHSSWASR